jgi:hypothetical protein
MGAAARTALFNAHRGMGFTSTTMNVHPQPEIKSFDQIFWGTPVFLPATPVGGEVTGVSFAGITCLNEVQQGAAFYNRIGTKISIKSIHFNCQFYVNPTAIATSPMSVRYLIIYDRQPNGAYPAISDLLSTNDLGFTAAAFYCGINMQNRERFTVLRDKYIDMDAASGYNFSVNEYVKGRWESDYGNTAANIGEVKTGAILFVAFADVSNGVYIGGMPNCRIRYFD